MKRADDILSYTEMCSNEGCNLQRGMNYRLGRDHSIVLMSTRPSAPYKNKIESNGAVIIYEGHDKPRVGLDCDPKRLDQPETTDNGALTQNGLFHRAAQQYRVGKGDAERVHVYEKIKKGIWTFNGVFELLDSAVESDGKRLVFRFKLGLISNVPITDAMTVRPRELTHNRLIPSRVKVEVWRRDQGKCVQCGAVDNLHFDHVLPFSLGGTSIKAANIQLLCARHNLQKRAKIE